MPEEIAKKAWQLIHRQMDRTIAALKKAGRYGEERGGGQKRDADGEPKTDCGSFMASLDDIAKESDDMPAGAFPAAPGPGMDAALDLDVGLDHAVDVAAEIAKYLRKDRASLRPDQPGPLQLWWDMRKECPALAIVAMHYLCIPASSAAVERLFSQTGLLKTKLRNRMKPETLRKLIFTRRNWDDSLYDVRLKKRAGAGMEESKAGEEEEEEEDAAAVWAELEEEIVGDVGVWVEDELGLDELMGRNFVEPDDDFWAEIGGNEEEEPWLNDE